MKADSRCVLCNKRMNEKPNFSIGPECWKEFQNTLSGISSSAGELAVLKQSIDFDTSRWAVSTYGAVLAAIKSRGHRRAEHLTFARRALETARQQSGIALAA